MRLSVPDPVLVREPAPLPAAANPSEPRFVVPAPAIVRVRVDAELVIDTESTVRLPPATVVQVWLAPVMTGEVIVCELDAELFVMPVEPMVRVKPVPPAMV